MATLTKGRIIDEGTKWQSVEFKGKWETLEVFHADKEGDVEITMTNGVDIFLTYLNQEDLKLLSDHILKNLKPIKV
jgi:hypothetical protein